MKRDIYFDSAGFGTIRACIWQPEGKAQGVIQIVHGIAEHMDRYDSMANFFNEQGYLVVGEDHMGHGMSVKNEVEKGCFVGGWDSVVRDTYQLLQNMKADYTDVPYFLLGHSMGSFITRSLLCMYPEAPIDGCVLSGTAWMPKVIIGAGKVLASLICKCFGETKSSPILQGLMFGSYNNRIVAPRTEYDWLTNDESVVDAYIADPMSGFEASAGLIREMLWGMLYNQNTKNLAGMNKTLPVFFLAGDQDPVGDYGKGVEIACKKFVDSGMENVTCKLYPGCRHEVHNEAIAEEMYRDVLDFMMA